VEARRAARREQVSDGGDRLPLTKQQQALAAPQLRCIGRLTQELQQSASFPGAELEWSHKPPPAGEKCKAHSFVKELLSFYLSRCRGANSWPFMACRPRALC